MTTNSPRPPPEQTIGIACAIVAFWLFAASTPCAAQEGGAPAAVTQPRSLDARPWVGPDDQESLGEEFRTSKGDVLDVDLLERWSNWKAEFAQETGFSLGADYTAVGFAASGSNGDDSAASGIVRVYGSWDLLDRGGENTGGLVYKIEHRHKYTDVPPALFGIEVGYAGTPQPVFNDDGYRTTELNWKQYLLDGRAVARVGFVDIKGYFNVYALASPWTGFHNLAFSTGANTQLVLPDGAFGAMLGAYLGDDFYFSAGIADVGADPTDVFDGIDSFFDDFDTFKTLEFGMTGGGKLLFVDNLHVALWQQDDSPVSGAQEGWGVNLSASRIVDNRWLPFVRAAWADEGGGLYEASLSTGFAYMASPGGNLLGVGLNWGRPNRGTFEADLDDQWTSEVFYRVQLTEHVQITSSIQLLGNPALNPDKDLIALFGFRTRMQF